MGSVLVSHPHAAAFAIGVADGLARADRLSLLVTGVAWPADGWRRRLGAALSARRPVLRNRMLAEIPTRRLRALPAVELGARALAQGLGRAGIGLSAYDALFVAHDAAAAALPWPRQTTTVYAYEDGAWATFRRARRHDLRRVWDLPLPHHRTIATLLAEEHRRWSDAALGPPHREPDWKQRRKDAELDLATDVAVASAFTRRSLEELGVEAPIVVTPYGFPVDDFAPRSAPPTGRFVALSVGSHDLRKGTPYLLEAWRRAAIPDAELHLVGPLRLAKPFLDRYAGLFVHRPHVARAELGHHYAAADLLVFPTLGDGFGMVIQEAMCSGTPVVTTPCGGGPECITDGIDGWIVPPRDIDALVARLRACAADRDATAAAGRAARRRAESWTWRDAGQAIVERLGL